MTKQFQFTLNFNNYLLRQNFIDVKDNVCSYFRGKINNKIVAAILTAAYYADPRMMHPCPYKVKVG